MNFQSEQEKSKKFWVQKGVRKKKIASRYDLPMSARCLYFIVDNN